MTIFTDFHGRPISRDEFDSQLQARFPTDLSRALHVWSSRHEDLNLVDGDARYYPSLLTEFSADELEGRLLLDVAWRQDEILMRGKRYPLPRLQQWCGPKPYRWSGILMQPAKWPAALTELRTAVEATTGERFNSALLNLYRNGEDTVAWHADDERGIGPTIASVSLGAVRDFKLRRNADRTDQRTIALAHGSLFVMRGDTQRHWQHCLPRRKRVNLPRINVTFRQIG